MYSNLAPHGPLKLYHFIIIVAVVLAFLSQLPSFHSLRHVNLISLLLCLAYSFCAVAGSIYLGKFPFIVSGQREIPVTSNRYGNAT